MSISSSPGTAEVWLSTIPPDASPEVLDNALDQEIDWIRNARTRSASELKQRHRAIKNNIQYLIGFGYKRQKVVLPPMLEMLEKWLEGYTIILNRLGFDAANGICVRSLKQLSQRDYEKLLLAINLYLQLRFVLNLVSVVMKIAVEEGDEPYAAGYSLLISGCEQSMFLSNKFVALHGGAPEHHKNAAFASLEAMIDVRLKRFPRVLSAIKNSPPGILREAITVTAVDTDGLDLNRFRNAVANEIDKVSFKSVVSLDSLRESGFEPSTEDTTITVIDADYIADILDSAGLSPQEREIMNALSTSCESNEEVAELLNIPTNQVAQAKFRAVRKIRKVSEKK